MLDPVLWPQPVSTYRMAATTLAGTPVARSAAPNTSAYAIRQWRAAAVVAGRREARDIACDSPGAIEKSRPGDSGLRGAAETGGTRPRARPSATRLSLGEA